MQSRLLSLALLIVGLFFFPWSSSVVQAQRVQPDRLMVTRAPINSIQVTQLVSQVSLVQKIYNHLVVLPHEPVHQVCPLYVVGVYHLKFLHGATTLEQTTYIQGGCALVILDQKDVRVPDTTFLNLLRQAGVLQASTTPQGFAPADLQNAYDLQGAASGQGQTIAIVDAYNNPNAERDLSHYRAYFGLPACTTQNGCFKKMNQAGGTWLPQNDQGWSLEMALDLDMVSAICPRCHILLVEANTPSFQDLGHAVNTAVILGASVVSNSYGSTEDGMSNQFAHYYNHPGATIVASAGDGGYGVEAPAAYASVIAVGGTSLVQDQNGGTRGWTESVWSGTGSGCSTFVVKPVWQHDTGCTQRMGTDVSAVADPATGVAVYSTYGTNGWLRLGGTSASAPIVAGVYGLAGNAKSITAQNLYSHPEGFYDVTSGNNGSCTPHYFCTAQAGYDGPTGLGTPHGLTSF